MSAPTPAQGNNIKVVCRFRPMNRMERDAHSDECIHIDESLTTVRLHGADAATTTAAAGPERDGFSFDRVFPATSAQVEIFDFGVKGIVQDVMMGFNGTLFCYGQTGSGKTFTMMGADIEDPELKGLVPRITQQIFASIAASDANVEYTVKVSYMEIYMERIRDLLAPANDNLSIHEDKTRGVYVKGLTDVYVGTEAEVYAVMKAGGKARAISATNMNAESSRSHSIFVVGIHQRNVDTGSQKSGNLYLVDLAGSEKVGKTGASGQTLEEAKKINKSLSALGMVINNLTDGKVSLMLLCPPPLPSADVCPVHPRPLPRLQAHPNPARIPRRQLAHNAHHQLLPGILQCRRNALHLALRHARQEYQEPCARQRRDVAGRVESHARQVSRRVGVVRDVQPGARRRSDRLACRWHRRRGGMGHRGTPTRDDRHVGAGGGAGGSTVAETPPVELTFPEPNLEHAVPQRIPLRPGDGTRYALIATARP